MCIVFLLKFNGSVNTQDRTLETMWITYASMCVSCLQKNVSRSNFAGFLSRFDVKLLRHTVEVCETKYRYIERSCKRACFIACRFSLHYSLHILQLVQEKQPAMTPQSSFQLTFLLLGYHTGGWIKKNPTWEQVMSEGRCNV